MSIENLTQALTPIASVFVAVVPVALSYYFSKKQQINADDRRLKEKYYLEYIEALSYNVLSDDIESAKMHLSDATNRILLIGSPTVVRDLRIFTNYIGPQNENFNQEEHDRLVTQLVKSMRLDLYKKKQVNKSYPTIGISGKNRRK